MGLLGGTEASDEAHLAYPVGVTWSSLRDAIAAHPRVVTACFNDVTMSVDFKTDMTFATYGQNFTAFVAAKDGGSRVGISGVAKRSSIVGRDEACIRKLAAEIFVDLERRVAEHCLAQQPLPAPTGSSFTLSVGDEIAKLAMLRARGFISAEEFDEQKRRLLSGDSTTIPPLQTDTRGPRPSARDRNATRAR